MTANDNDAFAQAIRKLDRLARLEPADRAAIRALPFEIATAPADHVLVADGDDITTCCILLEGYACRHKTPAGGGRQIVSFHMPGDLLDIQHLLLSRADHDIQTITPVRFARVPAAAVGRLARERPAIGEALWRDTLIDASVYREWVLNVGRRDARSRVAHMLCEFAARRAAAGLGAPDDVALPMTHAQIADATGLAVVHVNRVLHELGRDGVIAPDRREVVITDWEEMRRIAVFDAGYLHAVA